MPMCSASACALIGCSALGCQEAHLPSSFFLRLRRHLAMDFRALAESGLPLRLTRLQTSIAPPEMEAARVSAPLSPMRFELRSRARRDVLSTPSVKAPERRDAP
eukprot:CAMPEP_0174722850 /NCGR_PEP_ID=MMETSP1094-20130205/39449_1 /TAXON_ID=156173 /ORGANISM="Chrysochromulina brevifilum, Strain UTEX LB 985" /LENGTH=103 /DNA_ID=CAMNT_0015923791 /DNA_START=462 /DNA_END=769 /DNA_ORIENTATION=-